MYISLIKDQLFLFEKQTHTQRRENEVLTQRYSTISLKSHDNFLRNNRSIFTC